MNMQVMPPRPVRLDWVVLANAARARCFERDADNGALREIADFTHPASRLSGRELNDNRPGQAFKGSDRTALQPHTDVQAKEHAAFALQIADFLDEGASTHRYEHLALLASTAFLGMLRAALGPAASRVNASVPVDYTTCVGRDLERRVTAALANCDEPR